MVSNITAISIVFRWIMFLIFQRFSWLRSSSSRSASSACWSPSRWPWCTSSASTSTTESRWVLGVPNYSSSVSTNEHHVSRCCDGSVLTWWWQRSAARSPSSSSAPRGTAGTSCRTGSRTISRGHSDSLLSVRRTLKIFWYFCNIWILIQILVSRRGDAVCDLSAVPGGGQSAAEERNRPGECWEAAISHGEDCVDMSRYLVKRA